MGRVLRAVTLTLVTFGLGANAAVTTSFQNGESPDAGYLGVREVAIILDTGEPWRPDANYAGTVDWVDGFPTDIATLMRFDVSPIPTTATVIAVTLRVELTDATTDSYDVYALQRLWTPFEATWFVAASGVPWQTPGAQGPTDRASTNCGALTGGVGSRTIVFNTAGQQLVQSLRAISHHRVVFARRQP